MRNSDKSQIETGEKTESIGRMRERTFLGRLGENSFLVGGTDRQAPWEM